MTSRAPFHDYTIESVLIESTTRRMVIRAFDSHAPERSVSVAEFTGLAGYHLVGDVLGTILFGIEESDAFALYSELAEELQSTHERNGGHDPWVATPDAARAFIDANAIRGFELSSSIGAVGAIWARGFLTSTEGLGPG